MSQRPEPRTKDRGRDPGRPRMEDNVTTTARFRAVLGITINAILVRPLFVPWGHWLKKRPDLWRRRLIAAPIPENAAVAQSVER